MFSNLMISFMIHPVFGVTTILLDLGRSSCYFFPEDLA